MKLKISLWRITWRYLIAALFFFVILIAFGFNIYLAKDPETGKTILAPWGVSQILFTAFIFGAIIIGYVLSVNNYYYIVEDDYFIVKKFSKTIQYDYRNIEFIDIETSQKKKQVIFYVKVAKMRYLLGDKDGVLLNTLIEKCKNTMSLEDFRRVHPEEKY